jgi:hypothetical protein
MIALGRGGEAIAHRSPNAVVHKAGPAEGAEARQHLAGQAGMTQDESRPWAEGALAGQALTACRAARLIIGRSDRRRFHFIHGLRGQPVAAHRPAAAARAAISAGCAPRRRPPGWLLSCRYGGVTAGQAMTARTSRPG